MKANELSISERGGRLGPTVARATRPPGSPASRRPNQSVASESAPAPVHLVVVEARQLCMLVHDTVQAAVAGLEASHGQGVVPPPLMTRTQLAEQLALSLTTVDRLTNGGMPVVMVGGRRRYDYEDVMRWLRARQTEAGRG